MLGAILLRPSIIISNASAASQKRLSSGISRLTKLHRKQKVAIREERMSLCWLDQPIALGKALYPNTCIGASSAYRAPFIAPPSTEAPLSATGATPTATISLPYHVERTPSSNLPIYTVAKAGGTKHLTLIRKVSGDLMALKNDLTAALPPLRSNREVGQLSPSAIRRAELNARKSKSSDPVTINSTTGHVIVKGWRKEEIGKFLKDRGM